MRQTALEQLEQGVGEPGDTGLAAALSGFRSAWHHLANTPGNGAARGQVLSVAGTVAAALHDQSTHLTDTTAAERQKLVSVVDEVNGVAASLADCNRAITVGTLGGADVSILLDTRHQLSLRLTELTGSMTTIRPDGGADVSVLGVPLVSGHEASVLRVASGVAADGSADGARVTFDLTAPGGATTTLATAPGGETGALDTLLDVTLPAYRQGLDAVASALADSVNALHRGGFDAAGNPGAAVFSYEASDPATSFAVALTDPALVAASSVPGGGLDAGNADRLATAGGVEGQYQRLVSGLGTTVQSARWAATNQQVLTTQFASAREQLAGVSLDEETVSKMQNQRAFEAASKVLSTLDSVLDTLINRMLA